MPEAPPERLRDYLKTAAPDLSTVAEALWLKSGEIHDRQNHPDSNENGRRHVERVEADIWRFLTETRGTLGRLNLQELRPFEIFVLSCAACCHDFDKALKSANPLPDGFEHGEGSGAFVVKNAVALGLNEHHAKAVRSAIGIHNLKTPDFQSKLNSLNTREMTPWGAINLQRVALLLKAADMLHCDYSRIQQVGIDPAKLEGLERKKHLARKCTKGWDADGSHILIQAEPDNAEETSAFGGAFEFMQTEEWTAVAGGLERWGFPHRLSPDEATASLVGAPEADEEEEPEQVGGGAPLKDLLKGYPEPQPKWVGRVKERNKLRKACEAEGTRVYAVVGFGGEGKTALVRRLTETLRREGEGQRRPVLVWWSFYFNRAADEFFAAALGHFGISLEEEGRPLSAEQRAAKLTDLLRTGVGGRPVLLVLDGLESMQDRTAGREGLVTDTGLRELLSATVNDERPDTEPCGTILITTRAPLRGLKREGDPRFDELTLEELSEGDGVALLTRKYGLEIEPQDVKEFVKEVCGHALTLTLTGALLSEGGAAGADLGELRAFIASKEAKVTDPDLTRRTHRLPGYVLRHYGDVLGPREQQFIRLLSCCVRPATRQDIEDVFLHELRGEPEGGPFNDKLAGGDYVQTRNTVIRRLLQLRLIGGNERSGYDMHPLVRRHFYEEEGVLSAPQRKAVHTRFFDVLTARPEKRYPDTMAEMLPLIDAALHGCRAGRAQAALDDVYYTRIGRKDTGRTTFYLSSDLGAVETELEVLRSFFPDGHFSTEPIVSREASKAYLIGAAGLATLNIGRPSTAVSLFARGLGARQTQSDWANASVDCANLCESYLLLGRLPKAAEAAAQALDYVGRLPAGHLRKREYTQFGNEGAATTAASRGDDEAASKYFAASLKLDPDDWLIGLGGARHCTWLARRREFNRARSAAENNTRVCREEGQLHGVTLALATQGLVERLAWAADDPDRGTLDQMCAYAADAVQVARRSGYHFYLTYALLEAGRCAVTRAVFDPRAREASVREAQKHLTEAEQRAEYAEYRLILADAHVARAQLANLADDHQKMTHHCREAMEICDDPECGYAWVKEDARRLLDLPDKTGRRKAGPA